MALSELPSITRFISQLNAKVGALITQSHTTPTLEIELKSKKVECEKLKNELKKIQ